MDTVRRMKLQMLREKIVQDLDVEYVFDYLISNHVLSVDDVERINGEVSLEMEWNMSILYTSVEGRTHVYIFIIVITERHWNIQEMCKEQGTEGVD